MQSLGIDSLELIVRLQSFALGNDPDAMSDAQVDAALGLLDRVLPNRNEIELRVHQSGRVITKLVEE
jgi:hypothetical protein